MIEKQALMIEQTVITKKTCDFCSVSCDASSEDTLHSFHDTVVPTHTFITRFIVRFEDRDTILRYALDICKVCFDKNFKDKSTLL